MPHLTRRQFVRSSLILGAGLSLHALGFARAQDPRPELTGNITPVHDPTIIKEGDTYYLFTTGAGIPVRKSKDLINWKLRLPPVNFAGVPDWAREIVPGQNEFWAPDISYYNNRFHLYYSVSLFGMNRSVIGLATNETLDFNAENYEWIDQGLVVQSTMSDNYNCIDPNVVLDADGVPWLAFGSFWSGIKMRRLDYATGKPSEDDTTLYPLAMRTTNNGSVEGPFVLRKGDFYYLFVSFDFCCQGVNSTYRVMVGRSETVTGPYVDRDGVDMVSGGGTQVIFPTERYRGPGGCSILQEGDLDTIIYHAYDVKYQGAPTLRIDPLVWDAEGWPSVEAAES